MRQATHSKQTNKQRQKPRDLMTWFTHRVGGNLLPGWSLTSLAARSSSDFFIWWQSQGSKDKEDKWWSIYLCYGTKTSDPAEPCHRVEGKNVNPRRGQIVTFLATHGSCWLTIKRSIPFSIFPLAESRASLPYFAWLIIAQRMLQWMPRWINTHWTKDRMHAWMDRQMDR